MVRLGHRETGTDTLDTKLTHPSKVMPIRFTTWEGGEWNILYVHSLEMPDSGAQWDVVNGWRKNTLLPQFIKIGQILVTSDELVRALDQLELKLSK